MISSNIHPVSTNHNIAFQGIKRELSRQGLNALAKCKGEVLSISGHRRIVTVTSNGNRTIFEISRIKASMSKYVIIAVRGLLGGLKIAGAKHIERDPRTSQLCTLTVTGKEAENLLIDTFRSAMDKASRIIKSVISHQQ